MLTEHGCKIAPNTYWVARKRPPSARAIRDAELVVEIRRVYSENLFVYGADKIWTQLNREDISVGRGRVERLMRQEGISGARRGKAFTVTTRSDDRLERPADLVSRDFKAPAPNRLWVADLTYLKTHIGWVYVAFIIDVYLRFIVGWQASRSLRSDLAIDALEMAVFNRRRAGADLSALVHHSDRGVHYMSIRYSERFAENEIVASVGSKGYSYDNALAESFNAVMSREPWLSFDAQALAPRIASPSLFVHADGALAPHWAKQFHDSMHVERRFVNLEPSSQVEFYDRPDRVDESADLVAQHLLHYFNASRKLAPESAPAQTSVEVGPDGGSVG